MGCQGSYLAPEGNDLNSTSNNEDQCDSDAVWTSEEVSDQFVEVTLSVCMSARACDSN